MSPVLNVAIIGAGIGAQHLAGYRHLPARFNVVTLCDVNEERARDVIGDDQGIRYESSFDAVLADSAIDLVDICLPPHLHYETCMAALEKNKHVVCEKPLVNSLQDADALVAQASRTGKVLSPVFQYRYGLATAQLSALIDAGLAGKPYVASIETHWNRQSDYYDIPWRGTWEGEQGGAVLGHAIHNHDLLCAFFGPVRQLSAFTEVRVNDIETEDCAAIAFLMENGATASSSVTLGAANDTTRLRFCFEKLTATSGSNPYAPAQDNWTFSARGAASQQAVDECVAGVKDVHAGYTGFFSALADTIAGKPGNEVTLADGRRSLELVSAVYYASRHAEVVQLPIVEGHKYYSGWSPEKA